MGRTPTGKTTKTVRIPSKFEDQVHEFVTKLKAEEELGNPWSKYDSGRLMHKLIEEIEVLTSEITQKTKELTAKTKQLKAEMKRMGLRPTETMVMDGKRYRYGKFVGYIDPDPDED